MVMIGEQFKRLANGIARDFAIRLDLPTSLGFSFTYASALEINAKSHRFSFQSLSSSKRSYDFLASSFAVKFFVVASLLKLVNR